MLSRLRRRAVTPPDPDSINYTAEHVSHSKAIARRRRVTDVVSSRVPLIRLVLASVGLAWLIALPYEALWKDSYVDEHAIQPAQVTIHYDWGDVNRADHYLERLEQLVDAPIEELVRSSYLQDAFSSAGLHTSNTSTSTYAHVTPPRSAGTEAILVSANWLSRDGTPNLRGVAMLLSLGDFLRGQNYWAFDFVLVVGEGYLEGLDGFMREYHELFGGVIWTGLNVDYPGHSFSHIGLFYEGVNGRLPNQDLLNSVAHIARWAGGVSTRLHDIDDTPMGYGPEWTSGLLGRYLLGAQHLLHHFSYAALGKASGGHGVLSRHRIDSVTLYCTPSTGPHGFHTLGRTLDSTLRSLNNLLERPHASYFFYLLPRPGKFIPVGNYLPAAILLGASITIGGFNCPSPVEGVLWLLPAAALSVLAWVVQTPAVSLLALAIPRPRGDARESLIALVHLLYGALIPTLAMVNFPQAVLLAAITFMYLVPYGWTRFLVLGLHPSLVRLDLRLAWETVGSLAWPGVFAVWLPLWIVVATL